MNERVQNLLNELEGKIAELKTELQSEVAPVMDTVEEYGLGYIVKPYNPSATEAELRTEAFSQFLKTGDVTHIAPDGQLAKKTPERELFAPYLFCTITKIVGRTVYFIRASDRMQMTRSAVMTPDLEGKIVEGPCVVYHNKVISQWGQMEKKQWQERGYAFNALFRA